MTHEIPDNHPLRLFFAGAIESAFYSELGICAPDLVDYLTNLLTDFVHIRDIYALRSVSGDILDNVREMIDKAHVGQDLSDDRRSRLIHRHVGDFTLYWTGLYPESFERFGDVKHCLVDYCERGKESYIIASRLSSPEDCPPAPVLQRLGEHFEDCVHGLTIARHRWEATDPADPPIQQIL